MLLALNNIRKDFPVKKGFLGKARSFVRAVDHIDLVINKGENLGLVGESGCGKTTLARILLRLIPLDEGTITFQGEEITRLHKSRMKVYRKHMQMVFQDPYNSLDPRYTIFNILKEAMNLDPHTFPTKKEKEDRIEECLTAVQLTMDMLGRYPHEFSGGERQRIAIARALIMSPKLLILDEAVSSLDILIQQQIIDLLLELQRNYHQTYLFISHNLKVVKKICDRIAVMYKGKIVELAATDELFENPMHPYTKELLTAAVEYKSVNKAEGFTLDPQARLEECADDHFVLK